MWKAFAACFILLFSGCTKEPVVLSGLEYPIMSPAWRKEITILSPLETTAPVQYEIELPSFSLIKGDLVRILAGFQAQGRVLSIKSYTDFQSNYAPYDIALGWGELSDTKFLDKLSISQGQRFWYFRYSYKDLNVPAASIGILGSNFHIICSSEEIASTLKKIKPADSIRLAGYLVEIKNEGLKWKSSTTRNDSGNGACELIYVTMLDILGKYD
jgi:hypothetical protein